MDVLLDVFDTFVLDRCYASIFPDPTGGLGNTTNDFRPPLNQHVGVYYPLEPSQWAEASLWKRDHILRQTVSLFLITW